MNKQEFFDKYFPDYKKKGLSEPKFMINDKVIVFDEDDEGDIIDLNIRERQVSTGTQLEWVYYVMLSSGSCKSFFESEIKLLED